MRVWATADIVLHEPVCVQGPQDAQHAELWPGVEDVVNDTLNGRRGDLRLADRKYSFLYYRNFFSPNNLCVILCV